MRLGKPSNLCLRVLYIQFIICNAGAAKVARTGLGGGGGGLLLLAACTEGPLLLVQQARLQMSQPA